ncbi:hypothetical protein E1091_16665, partial [Micromonospora fluostatini]
MPDVHVPPPNERAAGQVPPPAEPAGQVPLPNGPAGATGDVLRAGVAAWVTSAPLRALVTGFGGDWPAGPLADVLAALDDFSARHW